MQWLERHLFAAFAELLQAWYIITAVEVIRPVGLARQLPGIVWSKHQQGLTVTSARIERLWRIRSVRTIVVSSRCVFSRIAVEAW